MSDGEPAAAKAYRALERSIVTLELAPGSVATEGALIEHVAMGRTPVREAIQRLAWEGLIDVRPRAGLVIAPLRPGDWLRVLDARRGVDGLLASSAARFVTRPVAEMFRQAALSMQQSAVLGDAVAFLEADKALDGAMAAASHNPFAARVASTDTQQSFLVCFQREAGLAGAADHHVDIIRAIVGRDAERARLKAERLIALLRLHAEAATRRAFD
jgi:DNA-binding GntR family transcriptional regulator